LIQLCCETSIRTTKLFAPKRRGRYINEKPT
jgi:hypothetical protein